MEVVQMLALTGTKVASRCTNSSGSSFFNFVLAATTEAGISVVGPRYPYQ